MTCAVAAAAARDVVVTNTPDVLLVVLPDGPATRHCRVDEGGERHIDRMVIIIRGGPPG